MKEIKTRFSTLLDARSQDFNPVPTAVTLLDPTLPPAIFLPGKESLLLAAKRYIVEQVRQAYTFQYLKAPVYCKY